MGNNTKKDGMLAFWSDRANKYKSKPEANTNDIWLREVEIGFISSLIQQNQFKNILDFGCANGYTTIEMLNRNRDCNFEGWDLNVDMIKVATQSINGGEVPNISFRQIDVLEEETEGTYDFIYTVRVFQNMETVDMQKCVFDKLYDKLNPDGKLLYIESYAAGYKEINEDRVKMDLVPLPIHPHLTLITPEFDEHVKSKLELLDTNYLSSSYYLVTRLLYSYLAKKNNEKIDYNHDIHQIAAKLPQVGEYGPQRAMLFQKK